MRDLNGQVVAITGATAGIGAATARALVAVGAKVALGARRGDRLDEMVSELAGSAVAVEMDVRDPNGSTQLIDQAIESFGKIDALVANAGIGAYGGIMDLSDEQLKDMMDINVAGTVWPIRAAVPHFLGQGEGDIVIVASVAGIRSGADEAVYSATKFAQIGLAGGLDRELREKKIRVSTICPGGTATEFAMGAGRTPDMPGLADMMRPENIADAIVTVLSQPKSMRTLIWSMRSAQEDD
ncbi:MAG: SDR family oxidoreductase [Acidimicrobiia bacterium]|nr:SDR family oxidoreductase [Acidimicrobiia bacterium]MDX2468880.1 SDR family oxidoreductase [Acidimicrobiia bacterium]